MRRWRPCGHAASIAWCGCTRAARWAFTRAERFGPNDRLITWQKPAQRPGAWNEEGFAALPKTLTLRSRRLHVSAKGFRTRTVALGSGVLDAKPYPADAVRERYGDRWQAELHFPYARLRA
jgi:hypothetical protein